MLPLRFKKKPLSVDDVMRLLGCISEHEDVKVTYKFPKKGAMIAGSGAFIGGLVGGPPGIAAGKCKLAGTVILRGCCNKGL